MIMSQQSNSPYRKFSVVLMVVCGLALFLLQFANLHNRTLTEVQFVDLYQFITGLAFLVAGSYVLKGIKKTK
jgi:hypothetical protein